MSSSAWLSADIAKADFCQTGKVRDYEKPLTRLPRIPAAPSDGTLNFAPRGTHLGRLTSAPFQVGPGEAGFVLTYSPKDENPGPSRRLNWTIGASLVKLNRSGKAIGKPKRIEKNVKRLRSIDLNYTGLEFSFDVPGEPALYKVEITFENSAGKRLGRFGDNFRVLKPSLDVDLALNGTVLRRGELVRASLVNRGVGFLFFGLGQAIEYWDGAAWTAPPVKFPNSGKPIPAIGIALGPGEKATCWEEPIPANAVPGTYRFRTNVNYSPSAPGGRPMTRLEPSAEFTVTE